MSKPRYMWWGFARKMIRAYPELKQAWNDLHSQSMTTDYSGMPKGGSAGRTVESIALRQLPPDDQKVYDAVSKAVEITKRRPDGSDRISLIRYVYWHKKQHTVKDAALQVPVSKRTAERWHSEFVRLVGKCYGFAVVGGSEPKTCAKIESMKDY